MIVMRSWNLSYDHDRSQIWVITIIFIFYIGLIIFDILFKHEILKQNAITIGPKIHLTYYLQPTIYYLIWSFVYKYCHNGSWCVCTSVWKLWLRLRPFFHAWLVFKRVCNKCPFTLHLHLSWLCSLLGLNWLWQLLS